ncbi:MAG: hypothetical protein IPM54_12930 [Polyangiaceae bacterium]|nr:hypothetical protein [Polyangiaceae bacterium]
MKTSNTAERLLASIDWSILRALGGDGESVQHALHELLASESADAAERAYWGVENHAFVQGELFEVSEACSSVLIASLVDPREKWVRVAVLDLMFQILSGYPSTSPGTPSDIVQRCHRVVREGLWLLYREAICGERDAAFDVLEQLGEAEKARRLLSIAGATSN